MRLGGIGGAVQLGPGKVEGALELRLGVDLTTGDSELEGRGVLAIQGGTIQGRASASAQLPIIEGGELFPSGVTGDINGALRTDATNLASDSVSVTARVGIARLFIGVNFGAYARGVSHTASAVRELIRGNHDQFDVPIFFP